MKAQKKPTNLWDLVEDLGLATAVLDEVSCYSAHAETGIVVDRAQQVVRGSDLSAVADQLIDSLIDEQVLVLKSEA